MSDIKTKEKVKGVRALATKISRSVNLDKAFFNAS